MEALSAEAVEKLMWLSAFKIKGGQRLGQSLFNALYEVDRAMADNIRNTDVDPYYLDENVPAFFETILSPQED